VQGRGRFAFTAVGVAAASGRGKQAGGVGMRCVGGRIDGGGEGGGGRDTWATHVRRGVMRRSVGV